MKVLAAVVLSIGLTVSGHVLANEARQATVYKNPECGCCEKYADYLQEHGFEVKVVVSHDLSLIKQQHGVPAQLRSCHTTVIDGYVVEGHIPLNTVRRLLAERPDIKGISLPGMPLGAPGMRGRPEALQALPPGMEHLLKMGPFTIYEIADDPSRVYAIEQAEDT
jgi:hypothetical protein